MREREATVDRANYIKKSYACPQLTNHTSYDGFIQLQSIVVTGDAETFGNTQGVFGVPMESIQW